MTKPLTLKQIIDIRASDSFAGMMDDKEWARIVRRIEWEHKIGDDPYGFSSQGIGRQKEKSLVEQINSNKRLPNEKKWTSEKLSELLSSVRNGEKQAEIAERLGLTRQRVYELVRKAKREEHERNNPKKPVDVLEGLSTRARNSILLTIGRDPNAGSLQRLKSIHEAIETGVVLKGAGQRSLYEIKKFLYEQGFRFQDGWGPT